MDVYKIGIVLNLISNANRVLGSLAKDFERNERAAARLRSAMDAIGKATMLAGASAGLAFGMEKALKPAMEYQHQVALMNTSFKDQREIAIATGAAWKTAKEVLTSSPSENIKLMREITPAFGDVEPAAEYLTQVAKMKAILTSIVGSDKADQEFSAVKLQELRGSTKDPAEFARQIDMAVKAAQMTGGKILPSDLYAFGRQASPFARHMSDKFLYQEAPTGMQDMGAERFGTAITTLGQAVVNGRMTKASFDIAKSIGLIDKDAQYKIGSAGTIQLVGKKRMHGADVFDKDPVELANKFLMPALLKAAGGDEEKAQMLMGSVLSNRNGQRAALDLTANLWRIIKDADRVGAAGGIKSYDELMQSDPSMISQAASAQWEKMWTTLGLGVLPRLLPLMVKFVEGLDKLSGIFQRHPQIGKAAFAIGAAITALLGIAAVATVLGIALNPVSLGIAALIVISKQVTDLWTKTWPTVKSALDLLWQNLKSFFVGLPQRIMDLLTGKASGDAGNVTGWRTKAFYERTGGAPAPYVPRGGGASGGWGDVYLDKKKVGTILQNDMGKQMNGPSTSGQGFDPRRGYSPTDLMDYH